MSHEGTSKSWQVPLAPTTRRKRGLSLRSQLFNKSFTTPDASDNTTNSQNSGVDNLNSTQTVAASSATTNVPSIELEDFSNGSSPNIPEITVDESDQVVKSYKPYNTYSNNLSRSTTHLTLETVPSAGSSTGFVNKKRKAKRSRFVAGVVELKNRILGRTDLAPSENGRVVPISFAKDINEQFQGEYYDPARKCLIDERREGPYISNVITSSKYTIYSFLPKQLKAQFSKIANCYFMIVAIMQMVPSWSTTGKFTTIIPLMIFMSVSIAREGYDDWKRHLHDKEENNKRCTVIKDDENLSNFDTQSISTIMTETIQFNNGLNSSTASLSSSDEGNSSFNMFALKKYNLKENIAKWKHIKVGDILAIKEDEWIPADILLLSSTNDMGAVYIETMALDGETNLKMKMPTVELHKIASKASSLRNINQLVTVEDPNLDLYNFEGVMNMNNESIPLGPDNVIYRGSILRNTKRALGVVIFTGEETKIRMNNIKNPRTKAPKLQRNINFIVIFMVFVVASLSAFSSMAQNILYNDNKESAWYLYGLNAGTAPTLMGFIIMYNTLIPLSLYVTMEIIKVGQLLLLQCDIDMYHEESNTPADAKTATILEELGQVSYIFSDKTGTLTDNKMLFRKFSINGVSWLHDLDLSAEQRSEFTAAKSQKGAAPQRKSTTTVARESMDLQSVKSTRSWISPAQPRKAQELKSSIDLLKFIQSNPGTLFSKRANFFLLSIALCSTCLPKKKEKNTSSSSDEESLSDQESDAAILYQAASPDERALVEAARDLGYIVFDKRQSILTIKTYPKGFKNPPKFEEYKVLDVIEFSSSRKRMSIIVLFPDNRICIICKGADNVIIDKLKNRELAKQKAVEITANSAERKDMEADAVLQERFSQDVEVRASISSLSSIRRSLQQARPSERVNTAKTMSSIDDYLMRNEDSEIEDIAQRARKSLHIQQAKRYSLDTVKSAEADVEISEKSIPDDRLLINEEFVIEKTLEHIEDFSTEGLRTLLYAFRWLDSKEYEAFSEKYQAAKIALTDRSVQLEEVGETIEHSFDLMGATAIEDKLQEGVSDAIERLRRAGIKMWMLTGDKRETAINIGYSCRLIKDYSLIAILNIDQGTNEVAKVIHDTTKKVKGGSVAHCVVVIDGATLKAIEEDEQMMALLIDLCVLANSAICCRASPSQKAHMVSAIRSLNRKAVTLAIGDGANDIAMIQSADIGVGITGREGLQAARASDYSIAQFRFLLKLLLVNGRYNYVRTSKFVLCTFYKELVFYLTQAIYQRQTLFSGSSVYESWSLSMFNTLFTSLPVIVVGIFDKDLKPATLLAVPELYAKGRLYQAFNLKVFVSWMVLAAAQAVGLSFLAWYLWGFSALRDNTTLPLGTLTFAALVIIINAKCELIEMQNRNWLAFAAFIISVGGYGLWNLLIMILYRTKAPTIFYVDYGLLRFGADQSWWATLLVICTVCLLVDILIKVFKYAIKPSDDEVFKTIERDLETRRNFEEKAFKDLKQGWTNPKEVSSIEKAFRRLFKLAESSEPLDESDITSAGHRKRAGTNPGPNELPAGGEGTAISSDFNGFENEDYEILPSGKKFRKKKPTRWAFGIRKDDDEDIEAIISDRLAGER